MKRLDGNYYRIMDDAAREGSINLLLQIFAAHWPEMRARLPEIISSINALSITDADLTLQTSKALESLPQDISSKLHFNHRSAKERRAGVARIFFPVVDVPLQVGHVRELQIIRLPVDQDTAGEIQAVLERTGVFVARTLAEMTGKAVTWHPHRYMAMIPRRNGRNREIEGRSLELPLSLALFAAMTGQAVPTDISATGCFDDMGELQPVAGLSLKLKAIRREKPAITRFIVSTQQDMSQISTCTGLEIIQAKTLSDVFLSVFAPPYLTEDLDLDEEEKKLEKLYDQKSFLSCIHNATEIIKFLEAGRPGKARGKFARAAFTCYWRRGSCRCHQGRVQESISDLARAKRIFKESKGDIGNTEYQECLNTYAVALKDSFCYGEAEKIHREIHRELTRIKAKNNDIGKNLSSWSQLSLACGRFAQAEKLQKKAIGLIDEDDLFRNYGYLVQIYTRWNKKDKAARALEKGRNMLNAAANEKRKKNLPYFDWMEAEYLYMLDKENESSISRLQGLQALAARHEINQSHAAALIHKFNGLVKLHGGDEKKGLDELDAVIEYFNQHEIPMYKLLEASVRVCRASYFAKTGRNRSSLDELEKTRSCLTGHQPFCQYFQEDIEGLETLLSARRLPGASVLDDAATAIREKIPY